jgi:polar amino acid transport system substrate-binding protein
MRMKNWKIACLAAGALAATALFAAACGDDDDNGGTSAAALTAATVDCKSLGVDAPKRIKDAGKFVVASDLSYAPIDFTKEGTQTAIGLDADIAGCIAAAWGVKADIQNTSFDAVIPALTGKKVDVIMSAMSDTPERRKEIDFVDYFNAGSGILVKQGNPQKIKSLADLCGKDVSIQVATVQIDEAKEQNAKCEKKITVSTFEQNTDTIQALASGRTAAALMDYPVASYGARQVKGLEVVGEQYNTGPYGIAVRKDDSEVKAALEKTIKAMQSKGQYDAILKYWGLEAGKLK